MLNRCYLYMRALPPLDPPDPPRILLIIIDSQAFPPSHPLLEAVFHIIKNSDPPLLSSSASKQCKYYVA